MLVLNRKVGQRVRIEGPCTITLVRVRGDCQDARIGIEAAPDVTVLREEVSDRRRQRENHRD